MCVHTPMVSSHTHDHLYYEGLAHMHTHIPMVSHADLRTPSSCHMFIRLGVSFLGPP